MQYQKTHHFFSNQVQIAAFGVPKISCLSRHVPNFVTSLQAATQSSVPTLLGSTSLMKFRGSVSPGPPGENIWQNPPLSNVLYPHCSKSFLHFFKNSKIIIFIFNNLDLETQKGHCLFWGETNWTNFNIQALNKKKSASILGRQRVVMALESSCVRGEVTILPIQGRASMTSTQRRGRSWMRSWPVVAKLTTARRINFR